MMMSKAVSHLCFMLIAVILARSLPPVEFGTFNQVWLVNRTMIYLFALGLPVSVYYFLPRLPSAEIKGFILQTMLGLALLAIPFAIGMYTLADTLALYFHNPALAHYLRLFAIFPLVTMPTISTHAILISLGRTTNAAIFEVATKVVMILSVAAAATVGGGLGMVFKALVIYGVVQSLLGLWLVWRPLKKVEFHFSLSDWKAQLAFAAPFGFSTLAGILNYQVDKVVIALFYAPAVFALYAAGAFEIPLAGVTSVPVLSVTMPEFAKKFKSRDIDGFLALLHESMLNLGVLVFAVAAFLMVFAGPVITTLFGTQYADSALPFRVYLLFLPLRITLFDQVLASLGDTRYVLKSQLAVLLVNIVLACILVRYFGWLGPAVSTLLAGYLGATMLVFAIRKRLNLTLSQLLPWRALGRLALVAILAAAGAVPIGLLAIGPIWKLAAGFLVFAMIYVAGNIKTQTITMGHLQTLRNWVSIPSRSVTG